MRTCTAGPTHACHVCHVKPVYAARQTIRIQPPAVSKVADACLCRTSFKDTNKSVIIIVAFEKANAQSQKYRYAHSKIAIPAPREPPNRNFEYRQSQLDVVFFSPRSQGLFLLCSFIAAFKIITACSRCKSNSIVKAIMRNV